MTSHRERTEQEVQGHLEQLREILRAGEDPREVRHSVIKIELDGTPAQKRKLALIQERAEEKHGKVKRANERPAGKPRKRSLVEQATDPNERFLSDDDDWMGLDS